MLPTHLLQYRQLFKIYGDFKYFNIEGLMKVSNFMSLEPVTGFNTINNILRLIKLEIPIDAPVIKHLTKYLLIRQIKMYLKQIRKIDESINFEDLDKFTEDQIDLLCFKRGIEINKNSLKKKKQQLKLWLSISNQSNIPHTLLLFTRINDYTHEIFEISDDEDEAEVLRTVSYRSFSDELLVDVTPILLREDAHIRRDLWD